MLENKFHGNHRFLGGGPGPKIRLQGRLSKSLVAPSPLLLRPIASKPPPRQTQRTRSWQDLRQPASRCQLALQLCFARCYLQAHLGPTWLHVGCPDLSKTVFFLRCLKVLLYFFDLHLNTPKRASRWLRKPPRGFQEVPRWP